MKMINLWLQASRPNTKVKQIVNSVSWVFTIVQHITIIPFLTSMDQEWYVLAKIVVNLFIIASMRYTKTYEEHSSVKIVKRKNADKWNAMYATSREMTLGEDGEPDELVCERFESNEELDQ